MRKSHTLLKSRQRNVNLGDKKSQAIVKKTQKAKSKRKKNTTWCRKDTKI